MASTTTVTVHPTRKPKDEGSIASVFSSLSESGTNPELPTRFADLKKEIWQDALMQSWREVLDELHSSIEEIAERGADVTRSSFHVRRALQIDIGLLFFVDYSVCTVLRAAEARGTVTGSNRANTENGCFDCSGRCTTRGSDVATSS